MSRRTWRGASAAAVVVLVAVAGAVALRPSAVDHPPRLSTADRQVRRLTAALGHPAGTTAVDVGAGRDLHGYPYVATVVSLAASVTPEQVAAVVESMPAATRRAGLPPDVRSRQLTFLTPDGARLAVAWQPRVRAGPLVEAAAGWLTVVATLGDRAEVSASVLTGGGVDYRLGLGAVPAGDVLGAYRSVARVAGPRTTWDLAATTHGATLRLSSTGPLDASRRRTWRALLRDTGRLGRRLGLSRLEVGFGDRLEVHLALLAADRVADRALTPAAYGPEVWPVLRPELAAVARATPHWSYFLSWAHRSRPAAERLLAALFGDQGTATGRGSSGAWAAAARALLPAGP